MNNTNVKNNNAEEIDLLDLLFALKAKIVPILIATVLGGLISFAYTYFLVTPVYESTASMLVLSKETTLTSLADLQLGTSLTNDYKVLAVSRPVLEKVVADTGIPMTYSQLSNRISINNPSSSRILEFTVTYEDPDKAAEIVNDLAEVAASYISEQMEVVPPNIFEDGIPNYNPSNISYTRNVAIGAFLGMVLVCGIVILLELMDDTIKDEEDVQKYLGLSVLAAVPDRKDYINVKARKKRKKAQKMAQAAAPAQNQTSHTGTHNKNTSRPAPKRAQEVTGHREDAKTASVQEEGKGV
jgi:capsular polysaccharide biosynthesis protein